MYQPSAPCSPPSSEQSEQPRQECARYVSREPEGEEGHKEGDADQAPEEAMAPFPPIDGLELIEAHAAFQLEIFGDLLVGVERLPATRCPTSAGWRR